MVFGNAIQASVSVRRLNKYLNMEELDKTAVSHDESFGKNKKYVGNPVPASS